MKSTALHGLVTLMLSCLIATPALADRMRAHIIEVQGTGEVRARPDIAWVTIGVESRDQTAIAAVEANAASMRALLQALTALQIPERNAQTGTLNLSTDYRPMPGGGMQPSGFVATQSLDVRVQQVDQLGPVLDALVAAGANQIRGVRFDIAEPGPLLDQALEAAVGEARRKAELLAQAAGVQVGNVLQITELGMDTPPRPMLRTMEADAVSGMPVAIGENTVSARVGVVFALVAPGE